MKSWRSCWRNEVCYLVIGECVREGLPSLEYDDQIAIFGYVAMILMIENTDTLIFRVSFMSCSEGLRLPEGWLCATMTAVAVAFKATANNTLTSTIVPVIPPLESAANAQGKCPLRIQLIHDRQKKEITLPGARVHPSKWHEGDQKVKNDDMLNVRIEGEVLKYRAAINNIHALNIPIDLDEVVAAVRGKKILTTKAEKLTNYIKENFEENQSLAYSTKKNFASCRKRIDEFSPNIKLHEVDVKWMHEYAAWLRKNYNLADWTMHTRMKIIKRAMRHAYEEGVISKVDLSSYKLKAGNSTKKFVTMNELRQLVSLKELEGHSDIKETQKYLQVIDEQKSKASKMYDSI